jgi:hypothetical protein
VKGKQAVIAAGRPLQADGSAHAQNQSLNVTIAEPTNAAVYGAGPAVDKENALRLGPGAQRHAAGRAEPPRHAAFG